MPAAGGESSGPAADPPSLTASPTAPTEGCASCAARTSRSQGVDVHRGGRFNLAPLVRDGGTLQPRPTTLRCATVPTGPALDAVVVGDGLERFRDDVCLLRDGVSAATLVMTVQRSRCPESGRFGQVQSREHEPSCGELISISKLGSRSMGAVIPPVSTTIPTSRHALRWASSRTR